jgi:hypothetical protein
MHGYIDGEKKLALLTPWSTIDDKSCISCKPQATHMTARARKILMVTSCDLRLSSGVMSVGIRTIEIGVAAY